MLMYHRDWICGILKFKYIKIKEKEKEKIGHKEL